MSKKATTPLGLERAMIGAVAMWPEKTEIIREAVTLTAERFTVRDDDPAMWLIALAGIVERLEIEREHAAREREESRRG